MWAALVTVAIQLSTIHAVASGQVTHSSGTPLSSAFAWTRGPRLPKDVVLHMDVSLAVLESRVEAAAEALQDMSDPASHNFGKYWTAEKVVQHFAPPVDSIREVIAWLNDSGIPRSSLRISPDQGHVYFNASVHKAEQLLNTEYYEVSNGRQVRVSSDQYNLPPPILNHVDFIHPTIATISSRITDSVNSTFGQRIMLKRKDASATVPNVDCFKFMTPDCLRLLYNIPKANTSSHSNSSLGIYEVAWSTWLPQDLDAFFSTFEPELVSHRPEILSIDGGYFQTNDENVLFNLEANLDFQYSMSLAYPLPVTNIQVGDEFLLGDLNTMLAAFDQQYCATALDPGVDPAYPDPTLGGYNGSDCGIYQPPLVISISYTFNEAWYSEQYVQRQCKEYLKLGLQGVTVIAATGDRGTADEIGGCLDPETGAPNVTEGHFSSNFPVSCPWVTAVGATQLVPTNQSWVNLSSTPFPPQTVYNQFLTDDKITSSSGGGFSNVFAAPPYQSAATNAYLSQPELKAHLTNLSSAGYFNDRGRGYPDVSLIGVNYLVVVDGELHQVLGTSASTPVFASMIARINDARFNLGKGPVGFINPVLYAYANEVMTDIIMGANTGCGVSEAFPARKGWDAATGLGTPDFQKLLDLYLHLP